MLFESSFKLPFTAVNCLLKLLRLLCPSDSKLPRSVYYLRKFFNTLGTKQVRTQYCSNCSKELDECLCVSKDEPDCHIQMDIAPQFKTILSNSCYKFYSCLGHWNDLSTYVHNSTSAMSMFRHDKHFFSAPENVGVILNTDGVPLFKSSSSSVWPVYLEIANLPPHLRFRHDNTITCGLWVGKKKPNMATLLEPTLKELNYLVLWGFNLTALMV